MIDPDKHCQTIAEAIRHVRTSLGMTQEKLAYRSSLSVRTIRNAELDLYDPRTKTIEKISYGLGVPALLLYVLIATKEERKLCLSWLQGETIEVKS
jgi:transcriptional regulator with XRE-family HTH domain